MIPTLVFLMLFIPIYFVNAQTFEIPTGNSLAVPSGSTIYFGSLGIGTSESDVFLNNLLENDWLNYSVSGVGIQHVYYAFEPTQVFFNGVESEEGVGWSYASGDLMVAEAYSTVQVWYGVTLNPSSGSAIFILLIFVVIGAVLVLAIAWRRR